MGDQLLERIFLAELHHHMDGLRVAVVRMIRIADDQHVLRGDVAVHIQGHSTGVDKAAGLDIGAAAPRIFKSFGECLGSAGGLNGDIGPPAGSEVLDDLDALGLRDIPDVDGDIRAKLFGEAQALMSDSSRMMICPAPSILAFATCMQPMAPAPWMVTVSAKPKPRASMRENSLARSRVAATTNSSVSAASSSGMSSGILYTQAFGGTNMYSAQPPPT